MAVSCVLSRVSLLGGSVTLPGEACLSDDSSGFHFLRASAHVLIWQTSVRDSYCAAVKRGGIVLLFK